MIGLVSRALGIYLRDTVYSRERSRTYSCWSSSLIKMDIGSIG